MGKENKAMEGNDYCTGFVQALDKLYKMRGIAEELGLREYVDAFNVIFRWIDEMCLLLDKIAERKF